MGGGDNVVCTGWLRKSPPEKKLRCYAWKKTLVYIVERPDEGQPGCSVMLQERTLQETPVDRQLKLLRAGGFRPDFQHERAAEWFCV